MRDIFGFAMLESGAYTAEEIDVKVWKKPIMERFLNWFKEAPEVREYRYLDWTEELKKAEEIG